MTAKPPTTAPEFAELFNAQPAALRRAAARRVAAQQAWDHEVGDADECAAEVEAAATALGSAISLRQQALRAKIDAANRELAMLDALPAACGERAPYRHVVIRACCIHGIFAESSGREYCGGCASGDGVLLDGATR